MSTRAAFTINGRFLTQQVTGVQRYARNVAAAMDRSSKTADIRIVAPAGAVDPGFSALQFKTVRPLDGHAWEQGILPLHVQGRLLNLCNTAPAVKAEQVVCIHDANIFAAPDSYGFKFRAFYKTLQPLLARRSAAVTTVSMDAAKQIALHLPIAASKIVVLPNGHEHALAWNASRSSRGSDITPEREFVLALGSRARHKNLQLLVTCAKALDELGLDIVVAGGDAGIFADTDLRAAPNVRMTGRVDDDDLAYLMDRALCLVFPSWTEGFGLPIVEAMARGLPVVSSNRASMPEICGDAGLMAAPDDPDAWVRQIAALCSSKDLREQLKGKGREQVAKFSWSNTAQGYEDLMQKPIAQAKTTSRVSPPADITVAVATLGRPDVVSATVRHLLAHQTLKPNRVIVSCVQAADAGDLNELPDVTVIVGERGLPTQRNAALRAMPASTDIVAFFDDDFVADPDWLKAAAAIFLAEPAVVGFTGHVLADGIHGPGIGFDEAVQIVASGDRPTEQTRIEPYSPYGCNMAFRTSAIGEHRFDERLVLYGWLEDRDFSAGLLRRGGRCIKDASARGVHMGVKAGRVPGDRLGYSQVVNPIYMLGKGTMTVGQVADHMFRNVVSNVVKSVRPEPFVDRRGRLKGNLRGLADILRGRVQPELAARTTNRPA